MSELKKYLSINSLFSGLSGIVLIFLNDWLCVFFGVDNKLIFPIIGINLTVFSAFVWYVSRNQITNKALVNLISGLDVLWVVGSLAIISFNLFNLTSNGNILIGIVAIWIAFLGFKQIQNNT